MAKKKEKTVSTNERKFVELYIKTGNKTQAYLEVYGGDRKTASTSGSRMLARPHVKAYYDELMDKATSEAVASASEVLEFWTNVMREPGVNMKYRLEASAHLGKYHSLDKPKTETEEEQDIVELIFSDELEELMAQNATE